MKQYQAQFWKVMLLIKEDYFPRYEPCRAGGTDSAGTTHEVGSPAVLFKPPALSVTSYTCVLLL